MKQKLFENVGGNQFKLITESVEDSNPKAKLVREGLKRVFSNGIKELSYKYLQGIGLGYIKQVEEAKKTAIQEARTLAKEYGYMDQEESQKFVKENDFSKLDAQDPSSALAKRSPEETDMSNPEESREVQLAKKILQYAELLKRYLHTEAGSGKYASANAIAEYAKELIQMHGQQ